MLLLWLQYWGLIPRPSPPPTPKTGPPPTSGAEERGGGEGGGKGVPTPGAGPAGETRQGLRVTETGGKEH